MYKTTGPTHPDCSMVQRTANKGTSCRLPTTTHGPKPTPGVEQRSGNFHHQDEPSKGNPTRQHYQFATGKRVGK